jgi:xanthine dehydrogenase accessory factor
VGLACGGKIDIFLQQADPQVINPLLDRIKNEQRSTLLTTVGGNAAGTSELLDEHGAKIAGVPLSIAAAINGKPMLVTEKDSEVFVNPLLPSPTLVMIGGVHIAVALAKLARVVEFRTIIVDPRKAFNTPERFSHVDQMVQAWPQAAFEQVKLTSATAVASLSHDPKIDDPALIAALASDAFYVGALGSTRTAALRRERLLATGVSAESLARLHAPIGLEINAKTPEEIALAIMADVIAAYRS